jgi:MYXO-CTERM domain-containing protein
MKQLGGAVLAVMAAVASACAPNEADPPQTETSAVISNRNLDVLFMIDNSASMNLSQANLLTNFPTFMNVLKDLPGGLPNIHVAVVSSDMGAGDGMVNVSCSATGDNGVFQSAPRGTCTSTTLLPGATFISNVGGSTNYAAPDIATVFACIAALGQAGCGFESPFASVLRALGADDKPLPAENQGFLRADALLAIIMVTNEDDCSTGAGVPLDFYDGNTDVAFSSPFGPSADYRCNEFGHLCDGVRPPRMAPNGQVGDTVTLHNCTSSECDGLLTPVAEVAARIKTLKAAPASEILVAAITGPATPYQVHWAAPFNAADASCGMASCPRPQITHSCTATDGSYADPAVRVTQFANSFGANGFVSSICDADFAPALQQIGTRIGTLLTDGGGTGGPAGRIPSCAVTGLGGDTGAGGGGGAGGSSGGGAPFGSDAAAGAGMSSGSGCGCQAGGAAAGVSGFGAAGAIIAWLAARRRRRRRA